MKTNTEVNQIINLTTYMSSTYEISVLRKGLGFVPTIKFNSFTWINDLHLFVRKLKWKSLFKRKNKHNQFTRLGVEEEDSEGMDILVSLLTEKERGIGKGSIYKLKTKE